MRGFRSRIQPFEFPGSVVLSTDIESLVMWLEAALGGGGVLGVISPVNRPSNHKSMKWKLEAAPVWEGPV